MACPQKEQHSSCATIESPYAKLLCLFICGGTSLIGGTSTHFVLISQLIWRLSTHLRPAQCAWEKSKSVTSIICSWHRCESGQIIDKSCESKASSHANICTRDYEYEYSSSMAEWALLRSPDTHTYIHISHYWSLIVEQSVARERSNGMTASCTIGIIQK